MGVVVSRALPFIHCDGQPATGWSVPATASANDSRPALAPLVFVTDGSFDGLLTAVFDAWAGQPPSPDEIHAATRVQQGLFDRRLAVATDKTKAARVWSGTGRF